jgi:hypothetical protein
MATCRPDGHGGESGHLVGVLKSRVGREKKKVLSCQSFMSLSLFADQMATSLSVASWLAIWSDARHQPSLNARLGRVFRRSGRATQTGRTTVIERAILWKKTQFDVRCQRPDHWSSHGGGGVGLIVGCGALVFPRSTAPVAVGAGTGEIEEKPESVRFVGAGANAALWAVRSVFSPLFRIVPN